MGPYSFPRRDNEVRVDMAEIRVCAQGEIADGAVRIVNAGRLEIGVIRRAETYYAYRNLCPHQGGPACEGLRMPGVRAVIENGIFQGQTFDEDDVHIVCPWHGYEFHLADGSNVCDPKIKLQRFDVVQRDGAVYVVV
jgi:nitrite reductase/ring-hydroxylating ferredoxin subunit